MKGLMGQCPSTPRIFPLHGTITSHFSSMPTILYTLQISHCYLSLRTLPIISARMVLLQRHLPQSGEVRGHSSLYITMPAVTSCCSYSLSVASFILTPTDKVTSLAVILDFKLAFDAHVSAVCKNVHFRLRALLHIRSSLADDMATSIAVALIHSRLDYANSLLHCES